MGVFICWSGERSRSHQLAEILRNLIPEILQNADPFMSDGDIDAGSAWMNRLTKALQEKRFGILCITPENKDNPWIHFEAGTLWKADEERRVCPLLYDIRPADITGPLSQLQGKRFDKAGFLELMREVNKRGCSAEISETVLVNSFNRVWPDIASAAEKIARPLSIPKPRSLELMVEDILTIVRSMQSDYQEDKQKLRSETLTAAIDSLRHVAVPGGKSLYGGSNIGATFNDSTYLIKPIPGGASSDKPDKNAKP